MLKKIINKILKNIYNSKSEEKLLKLIKKYYLKQSLPYFLEHTTQTVLTILNINDKSLSKSKKIALKFLKQLKLVVYQSDLEKNQKPIRLLLLIFLAHYVKNYNHTMSYQRVLSDALEFQIVRKPKKTDAIHFLNLFRKNFFEDTKDFFINYQDEDRFETLDIFFLTFFREIIYVYHKYHFHYLEKLLTLLFQNNKNYQMNHETKYVWDAYLFTLSQLIIPLNLDPNESIKRFQLFLSQLPVILFRGNSFNVDNEDIKITTSSFSTHTISKHLKNNSKLSEDEFKTILYQSIALSLTTIDARYQSFKNYLDTKDERYEIAISQTLTPLMNKKEIKMIIKHLDLDLRLVELFYQETRRKVRAFLKLKKNLNKFISISNKRETEQIQNFLETLRKPLPLLDPWMRLSQILVSEMHDCIPSNFSILKRQIKKEILLNFSPILKQEKFVGHLLNITKKSESSVKIAYPWIEKEIYNEILPRISLYRSQNDILSDCNQVAKACIKLNIENGVLENTKKLRKIIKRKNVFEYF